VKKNISISFLTILALFFFLVSCKGTKRGANAALKDRSAEYLLKKIEQGKVDATWLDAKAKLDFVSDEFSISATAFIRMKKDSAIWIVGKKFGIEGIRALVTLDSVYYLNRLEEQYFIKDISFLQKQFNLPMDFFDLQDILLGNAILLPDESALTVRRDSSHYILETAVSQAEYKSYTFNGQHFYPRKMYFKETAEQRIAQLDFGDHRPLEGTNYFSYFRALLFQSPETGQISMDVKFSNVELNTPKSLTFDIPAHYTKID
jgi:Domain of unknown function (DUF4292)